VNREAQKNRVQCRGQKHSTFIIIILSSLIPLCIRDGRKEQKLAKTTEITKGNAWRLQAVDWETFFSAWEELKSLAHFAVSRREPRRIERHVKRKMQVREGIDGTEKLPPSNICLRIPDSHSTKQNQCSPSSSSPSFMHSIIPHQRNTITKNASTPHILQSNTNMHKQKPLTIKHITTNNNAAPIRM